MKLLNTIMHTLDTESGNLVLSQREIQIEDKNIYDYIVKLISKFEKSEYFEKSLEEVPLLFDYNKNDFKNITFKIAKKFFDSIQKFNSIPGGDLLFFKGKSDERKNFFGFFKLNYFCKYLHNLRYKDNLLENDIVLNKKILPSTNNSIEEGIILYQGELLKIKSKKYQVGNGTWEMAKNVLGVESIPKNTSETIKTIKKAVTETSNTFHQKKLGTDINFKNAIFDSLKMDGTIDNDYIADEVFMGNEIAKTEFKSNLNSKNVKEVIKVPNVQLFDKKYSKQKLKLDNGITILIPTELIKDKKFVEFRTNSDGTTSVILKNATWIKNNL